jgi:DNA integrity scanning protein DisA with diadenylate cyclase activity
MDHEPAILVEHPVGQIAKVVSLYQTLLRRHLEHFFPEAVLEPAGDRSFINWEGPTSQANYRVANDPDGLGMEIEWFRTRYLLLPGSPTPFLPTERKIIEIIVRVLDHRFRAMFDLSVTNRAELFHYAVEDFIVTEYLDPPEPIRVPAALEALRVAALSTYENRRVSTGVLLLGTKHDPAAPDRINPPGAPRYSVRLSALKSFHRICDGLRTLFLVDRQGDLAWAVDIDRWADVVQGLEPLSEPCPRQFVSHAKATTSGGHVCLVLTPSQEIKVFAGGTLAFAFSDARWRLLDIPTKFATWRRAVAAAGPADLASRLFRAALNLSENRQGALFVVLRNPSKSLAELVAPGDRIFDQVTSNDPHDPDHLSPRMAKRALHHLVWSQHLDDLDDSVLEALAGIDGAVVVDPNSRLLAFGAILRISPETIVAARAVEGARTAAALTASYHGPVLKVSEDGVLTMYLGGRRVWEL